MVKAIESQGVVMAVSDGGSPSSFSTIGNITAIKGPGGSADVIDVTNLASTAKEKLMGLPDEGQITVDLNYDPDNTQHAQMRNARKNRTRLEFRITLTDTTNTVLTFFAYVLGFSMDIGVNKQVTVSVTLEVDGGVSEA
jgi:hypothetical protein